MKRLRESSKGNGLRDKLLGDRRSDRWVKVERIKKRHALRGICAGAGWFVY
jgi:hypothetical protein